MGTASAWPHEAAPACPSVPEAPNGPSGQGFGAPGSMAAVGGLVSGSAESALHAPAEPQPAERQPEPAQAERDGAQAGLLAGEHAAPAPLPAPVQLAASSLVRARGIPAVLTPDVAATASEHEGGSGGSHAWWLHCCCALLPGCIS